MKTISIILTAAFISLISIDAVAQTAALAATGTIINTKPVKHKATNLYIDVHHLGAGTITTADVAAAHTKDLAVQDKYHVHFIKYWVDTAKGDVYCLSSAQNMEAIKRTHAAAHGLLPAETYLVTDGSEAVIEGNTKLFLDVHEMGKGNVTAEAVAAAHEKDLATQSKYGVKFINYCVDEKKGKVFCLSEAADSNDVIQTHKEAHGLLPNQILSVKQGQ
jgi:hypothetical protein